MAKGSMKKFYHSKEWERQREYILKRDHYICTEPLCMNIATEVHHIIELTEANVDDVNICLAESNLRSLCHNCHTRITQRMKKQGQEKELILPLIRFDDDGYPIPLGYESK